MRVRIDRDECIACATCWEDCPEVFEEGPNDGLSQIVEQYRVAAEGGAGDQAGGASRFRARLRAFSSSRALRMRMCAGVTSTYSSALMCSRHSSRARIVGGATFSFREVRRGIPCYALAPEMSQMI